MLSIKYTAQMKPRMTAPSSKIMLQTQHKKEGNECRNRHATGSWIKRRINMLSSHTHSTFQHDLARTTIKKRRHAMSQGEQEENSEPSHRQYRTHYETEERGQNKPQHDTRNARKSAVQYNMQRCNWKMSHASYKKNTPAWRVNPRIQHKKKEPTQVIN